VLLHCARFYGPSFVFNPPQWGTADGYIPFRVGVAAGLAIQAIRASESLVHYRVLHPPAQQGDRAELLARLQAEAHPED
jgi:hypothetical protein